MLGYREAPSSMTTPPTRLNPDTGRRLTVVPQGKIVRYGYAHIRDFAGFAHTGGVQWEEVKKYAGVYAELADGEQLMECPRVQWGEGGKSWEVLNGRHRFLALLGVGYEIFLVHWLEDL